MVVIDMQKILCRATITNDCQWGQKIFSVYDDMEDYFSDKTYDPADGSVICDMCYIELGEPALPEGSTRQAVFEHVNYYLFHYKREREPA